MTANLTKALFSLHGPHAPVVRSLPEQLAEQLVEEIVTGVYAPGQRLQETALAEHFEVSRGPVREALRLLDREGLVTVTSWRGAAVARLTRKDLTDIFAVRAALMGVCAEALAQERPPAVLEALRNETSRLFEATEAGRVQDFIVLVYQLSMYIVEAAGNAVAFDVIRTLGRRTLPLTRRAFEKTEHRMAWADNWRGIVDAIARGDGEAARCSAGRLIATIKTAALSVLETLPVEETRPDDPVIGPNLSRLKPRGERGLDAGAQRRPRIVVEN